MALNLVSVLEIIFVLLVLPAAGFGLVVGLIHWKEEIRKYVEVFTLLYLGYFLFTWLTLDPGSMSSPVLGIPLGNSPVMLIVYIFFGIGMLTGVLFYRYWKV